MANKLLQQIIAKLLGIFVFLGFIFFLPAGTIRYWQAWNFMGVLLVSMLLIMIYLLRHDKALLERRIKTGEKEKPQKLIVRIGTLIYLVLFLIPGFDFRYGWSSVPVIVVILADVSFFLGYYIFFLTLRENSYASRVIEVVEEQKVISTGPYAVVRHPMYSAILLIMGISPLCLGSYWGLTISVPLILVLVLRILNEEKVLAETLPGYRDYLLQIKYRLIPGLW